MKIMRRTVLSAALILLFIFSSIPVSANSAQTWFSGVDGSGMIMTDENSPIVVEQELLTFHIADFPAADYLAYSSCVTAEYTFYNPSDYTVTARLLFPLGTLPDYGISINNTEQFDITINGEAIEKTLRHSFSYPYSQFDLERDLARLADGYVQDDFYDPDMPVTRYTYQISGIDKKAYPAASVAFDIPPDAEGRKILFSEQSGYRAGASARISAWASNGELLTVYIIGDSLPAPLAWTFYQDGGVEDGEEIEGSATLISSEALTFKELALSAYTEESGIRASDWYNAIVADFNQNELSGGVIACFEYDLDLSPSLMRWYEYEITLKPGERIVNTVTAPIYPAIDTSYDPSVYYYTYLLSPAKTWTDFGTLEIIIDTPYHMTASGMDGWERTADGYRLTLDGLPDGELEFTLCSAENPAKPFTVYQRTEILFFSVLGFIVLLIVLLLSVIIYKKKKRSLQ